MAGLFGDGIIPKNKSLNNFHSDIQEETELEKFLKKKRSIQTPSNTDNDFIYGKKGDDTHSMQSLLGNKYQKEYVAKH